MICIQSLHNSDLNNSTRGTQSICDIMIIFSNIKTHK